ncbi:MAG TPA: PLP-dependent aminotransferase family protein [Nakamurella sp.]|nr:PLP-dependent aminotransferase family protein [Nakamurella sp.]
MEKTWATSSAAGLDLHLDRAGTRVRADLERALREAVGTGRLAAGSRLPSSRALAADLGIARNTVAEAYAQLVAEGWLTARQGSGTRVRERPSGGGQAPGGRASSAGAGLPARAGAAPAADRAPQVDSRFDLRAGVPDLAAFPRPQWLAAARKATAAAPHRLLGYGDPRGCAELRDALAGYLARSRDVRTSPEQVIVCAGFTHALTALTQILIGDGSTAVAVEGYGHAEHRAVIERAGLTAEPLPLDERGARVDALTGSPARGVLLTPAHQFPTGVPLAADRRSAVVRWAAETGATVIEDDYDGEFRYDRQPLGALQALGPDTVVYAGTASKSLAPGLRLGWLAVPNRLLERLLAVPALADQRVDVLHQLTLAEFLTSGRYDRQVRSRRIAYRRRRDVLVAMLHREAPAVTVSGISAGLHALVRLPPGVDERTVVQAAGRVGVAVDGLATFAAGATGVAGGAGSSGAAGRAGDLGAALVVGYARPSDHAFTAAIARLCAVLRRALGSG